ncbi:MAG: hypothetical protein KA007_00500 [Candidatus Pacebacteria bacterium]|nr:hypothetical protein [Candidatus Paceibacterota bacterium]
MENKTCSKCKNIKSVNDFYFRKSKNGYGSLCKLCEKNTTLNYQKENREKLLKNNRDWKKNNLDKTREYSKIYKEQKKEEIKIQRKEYAELNKEKIRIYEKNYRREKMKNDPLYKLSKSIRNSIGRAFKIKNTKKTNKTIIIIGCTFTELKTHLESLFESWMNWENYGSYKTNGIKTWQIDHIIPISSAKNEGDIIKLNHFTNLRPLDSKENLDKSDKIL